jgi:L-fucose isomerase-like protein
MATKQMTMGVIVGNCGFFPEHLPKSGHDEILAALKAAGIDGVALTPEESKYGAVETRDESRRCADLLRRNRDRIDGIIVTLPNFGEERAIAGTLQLADLRVPVLIQATPDDPRKMTIAFRTATVSAARCRPAIICGSTAFRIRSRRCTRKTRSRRSSLRTWSGSLRCAE